MVLADCRSDPRRWCGGNTLGISQVANGGHLFMGASRDNMGIYRWLEGRNPYTVLIGCMRAYFR
jgi:hypothetical protein